MIKKENKNVARLRRHARVRKNIHGTKECPRLNVFRSNNGIYVQVIDDDTSTTLVSSSTAELKIKNGSNIEAAKAVGADIAKKCLEKKILRSMAHGSMKNISYKCKIYIALNGDLYYNANRLRRETVWNCKCMICIYIMIYKTPKFSIHKNYPLSTKNV